MRFLYCHDQADLITVKVLQAYSYLDVFVYMLGVVFDIRTSPQVTLVINPDLSWLGETSELTKSKFRQVMISQTTK